MLIPIIIGVVVVALIAFMCAIYKVAPMNKVLIVTGGKKPVLKVAGGSFVIPIFRKASYFDLSLLTVTADNDEVKTKTQIPIVINWTAQIRPITEDTDALQKAITSFQSIGSEGIKENVKRTLAGCVVSTVAQLTPVEVQVDKEKFKQSVQDNVADELRDMGLKVVSLNVGEITDRNGYYNDLAAKDREEKRKDAENIKAEADQVIREKKAATEQVAKHRELDMELQIAEKTKDNNLKEAEFQAETDKARADAAIAGELQRTVRLKELAEEEGNVQVVKWEQTNRAAEKEKEVMKTKAESEKLQAEIKAQELANVRTVEAQADAKIAEVEAAGKAKAVEREADGRAAAVEREAAADANKTRLIGETEADVITKKGKAEAEAIKAKKLAEAEGEKALAAARAGNDKVNFELDKIKILAQAHVEIATNQAKIMADFGKNAEFINVGNSATGNAFFDQMQQLPGLLRVLDIQNKALSEDGKSFKEELHDVVSSIAEPLKGIIGGSSSTADVDTESTAK